ncbi:MAG: selenocysteine-specific translation elongation factor [Candidatus Hydrogenedentes bacterium]|nr:selenocysteine-specific translation elongation factor [Candidatus Hydrogenedentota bacterium]
MATPTQHAPGLLRRQDDPDVIMMLCTAGHVDHGKTRLVGLLTGCATDRLKEEKERGLTIDLGFAPCMLGDGLCVGIVDVPGHEKFIKNMVAGVSGIDMAVLVVAADDGIMPQTIEHVQIMQLLGVPQGMVALTKTDLVTAERVAEVQVAVHDFVRDTFLDGAPVCPLSSETGEGVFEFYDLLKARIRGLARRKKQGVFRMPVERTFVQRGFGSVITGIPVAGSVRAGHQVELAPEGIVGRVRAIQRFLRNADEGAYGQCLALNIPEFGKADVQRGQVLCEPGYLRGASLLHVLVQAVGSLDPPLRNAEAVKVHTGTSEIAATVYLLEERTLGPGGSGLATLLLQRRVAAAAHDRFILRRPSPAATVAGGEILEVQCEGTRPRRAVLTERLQGYCAALKDAPRDDATFVERRVLHCLQFSMPLGGSPDSVARHLFLGQEEARSHLALLAAQDQIVEIEADYFCHGAALADYLRQAEAHVSELENRPTQLALTLSEFQHKLEWPQPLWRYVMSALVKSGLIEIRGHRVLLSGAVRNLSPSDHRLMDAIVGVFEQAGFHAPRPEELPAMLKATPAAVGKLLDVLYHHRVLVRLSSNVVLDYVHYRQAQDLVVELVRENGQVDSADFKHHIDSSRKYALAILDFLDTQRLTVRFDNVRKLAPDYEVHLL